MGAPTGTPIIDQVLGVIRDIVDAGGFGLHQIIDLGGGRQVLLGHESAFAVPSGTQVHPGQVIGYVGSSGMSTGSHLHFEEDVSGRPVDPSALLFGGAGGIVEGAALGAVLPGAGLGDVAGAISGLPASIAKSFAEATAVGVFARNQAAGLVVALVVAVVLFL